MMIQFSYGMRMRQSCVSLLKLPRLRRGIYSWITLFSTKWLQFRTKIYSLDARPTTISCLLARFTQELTSSLNYTTAILLSGCSSTVQYWQPQQQYSPSLITLLISQLMWKLAISMLQWRLKNLYSFYSLSSLCKIKLFPTCQMWQKSGEKGLRVKLRMGALKQGVQDSSPPEKQEAAFEKNPSPLSPLLKRCLTRQSRSLYSTTTNCPDRYPSMNSAWVMVTEVELALKTMLLTWMVAMILRGRMSLSTRVEVVSRAMSFLKGQTDSSPASERQSAATMKWWSCAEQVVATMQQGQVATRSLRIQVMTLSLASSFSILLQIVWTWTTPFSPRPCTWPSNGSGTSPSSSIAGPSRATTLSSSSSGLS